MSKGGGGSTNTVQKADPWEKVQPYLEALYGRGADWMKSNQPEFYPGTTLAPQAAESEAANQLATVRALQGSPINAAGSNLLGLTLGGQFLGANPYLDEAFGAATGGITKQFREAISPGIASQFALGGRLGSGAHQAAFEGASDTLAEALRRSAADIYGGAYEGERSRMQQALTLAPTYAAQ